MRLAALQSVVNTGPAGSLGYLRPHQRRGFPRVPWLVVPCRPPFPLRKRVHPLVSLPPLQSTDRLDPPTARMRRAPSLGFRSPSRYQPWRSTCEQVPVPLYVPPSAFRTPSTAYSLHDLVGLFHPTTTSGIHPSGVLPATWPNRLIGGPCPPVVDPHLLPPRHRAGSRYDGLAFRALIRVAIRRDRRSG